MGVSGSMLVGKAVVDDLLLPYTTWHLADLQAAQQRLTTALKGKFGLNATEFATLLGAPSPADTAALFKRFDSDGNGLVDAFEALGVIACAGQLNTNDRATFLFQLFDFNKSGYISRDEMVMLHNTIIAGCAKFDSKITPPDISFLESKAAQAFKLADLDASGEISAEELVKYTVKVPQAANFLSYWDGCLTHAKIPAGKSWEDPAFTADGRSLYKDRNHPPVGAPPANVVDWLRPAAFCAAPVLFSGPMSGADVVQGTLANRWFLNAIAILCAKPDLLQRLFVPTGQESQGRYCVQLYKDGDWMYFYVDDRIPCNRTGKPLYTHSSDPNELWPLLLEKAYAKAHGSYEALIGGFPDYALKDLSGGVPEVVRLDSKAAKAQIASGQMWELLNDLVRDGLVGLIREDVRDSDGTDRDEFSGILEDHAYTITELVVAGDKKMVHVRNPWGMREWQGPWSDGAAEWAANPAVAAACKYTGPVDDGCFWIQFEDLCIAFHVMYSCRLLDPAKGWLLERREGEWTPATAGGCSNNATWVNNQQFAVDLPKASEVVVTLTQPDSRFHVLRGPEWNKYKNSIGFVIAQFDWRGAGGGSKLARLTRLTKDNVKAFTAPFQSARDITLSVELPAGKYVVIPMTYAPGGLGKFWLSVYATAPGFDVFGGTEVVWDDVPEDQLTLESAVVVTEAKPTEVVAQSTKESAKSAEARAMTELHHMVVTLSDQLKALTQRKLDLTRRIEALST